jgi:hypothetical protein
MSFITRAKDAIKQHGASGVIVYHLVHYGILAVAFVAALLLPVDIGAYVNAASALVGFAALPDSASRGIAAAVFASGVGKVLIPLKLLLTVRLLPILEPKLARLWHRLRRARPGTSST